MRTSPHFLGAVAGAALTVAWAFAPVARCAAPGPRIGLVLEGGSALGLAHIGVITWLEEHHVPVTYVAGTSMGGLVGGLYATGNSPAQMNALVSHIDWSHVLRSEVPFSQLAYRRKEDERDYPNDLEFGLKHGVKFPEGLSSGYAVGLILDRIALPYSQLASFDQLPIPFACVATDLVSGKQHVFREGSLATALRSTMSLPAVFSPVRTDESIFVDGGLLDNLPVDVAKSMGADLVIAVHLQTKLTEATDSLPALSVVGKSMSVVVAANELRSMQDADILLSVPLGDYSSTDFGKSAEIIKLGYEAAASKAEVLKRFAVDDAQWQQYEAARATRRRTVTPPEFVEAEAPNPQLARDIEKSLSKDLHALSDPNQLNERLTAILGSGRYSRVNYEGIERDRRDGLLITAEEKTYAPPTVRPLVSLDVSESHQADFTLGARITFYDVLSFGSEWRNDVAFGTELRGRSAFYLPFGGSHQWFVEPAAFAFNDHENFYKNQDRYAEYRDKQVGGQFDFGHTFGLNSQLRAGYEAAFQSYVSSAKDAPFGEPDGRVGATSLGYRRLGRDDAIIPSRGTDVDAGVKWYDASPGATEAFPAAEGEARRFQPVSEQSSLFFQGGGGTTFGYEHTGVRMFSLGGMPDLVAYGTNEYITNQYLLFKAGYIQKLARLSPLFANRMSLFGFAEGAKVDYPGQDSAYPGDVGGSLVIKTLLGPVQIGGALGGSGHHKFFYQIGKVF